jgi:hypothetical protein
MNVSHLSLLYRPNYLINSTLDTGILIYNNSSNTSLKLATFDSNTSNVLSLEASNTNFNIFMNNELYTNISYDGINVFKNNFTLNDYKIHNSIGDVSHIASSQKFICDALNILEIDKNSIHLNKPIYIDSNHLPAFIPKLNSSNKIDTNILPEVNKSKFAFKTGRNVGFGTSKPKTKCHVANGDFLIEGGRFGINYNLGFDEAPAYPIHIRRNDNISNEIMICVEGETNNKGLIVYGGRGCIGIGTTEVINESISLFTQKDIHCRNLYFHGDGIYSLNNSISLNSDLSFTGFDILFDGLSLRKTVYDIYGNSNISFGRDIPPVDFKYDVLNDKKSIASFGSSNMINEGYISIYKENDFNKNVNIGINHKDEFFVKNNNDNSLTLTTSGDIRINKNNLEYNVITDEKYPFIDDVENTSIFISKNNNRISQIVCDYFISIVLYNNSDLYLLGSYGADAKILTLKHDDMNNVKHIDLKYQYIYCIDEDNNCYFVKYQNIDYEYSMNLLSKNVKLVIRLPTTFAYVTLSNELFVNNIKIVLPINDNIIKITESSGLLYILFDSELYEYNTNTNQFNQIISNDNILDISGKLILFKDNTFTNVSDPSNPIHNNALQLSNDTILNSAIYIDTQNNVFIQGKINGSAEFQKVAIHNTLLYPKFNLCAISDKHYIVSDGIDLFTAGINTGNRKYDGLGRINNRFDILTKCEIITKHLVSVKFNDAVCIGDNFKYIKKENIVKDSLSVERCVGIGTVANSEYALNIDGNINIINGNIFQNGTLVGTDIVIENEANNGQNISLENYPTYEYVDNYFYSNSLIDENIVNDINDINNKLIEHEQEFSTFEYLHDNFVSNLNFDNVIMDIFNEHSNINNMIDAKLVWDYNQSCNVIYKMNTSVAINSTNVENGSYTSSKIPALFVGNGSEEFSNIKGLVCQDDIEAFSDIKLKDNIKYIENPLENVLKLNGVTFTRNDIVDSKEYLGLIAQDVEKVIPQVVSEFRGTKTIAYANLVALLIESIKELNAKVEKLSSINSIPPYNIP